MWLSDSLIVALRGKDISGVKVLCEESVCDDVAKFFLTDFSNEWKKALLKVEQVYGDYTPADVPAKVLKKDYGFFISIGALEIRHSSDDYYDDKYGFNALDCALKRMKTVYPQVEYDGYICGELFDVKSGDVYSLELSTRKGVKVYDFVGDIIGNILATEMYIPEEPLEADGLNFVVTGKMKLFENREEFTEYIEDLGGNVTGSISKKTNYLINNDLDLTTAKNVKAQELGIPIISELEFISLFGDPYEFDIDQSEFWESFANELVDNDDFAETIESLYSYSDWIKKEVLDRTVRAIINIAGEVDDDVQEELSELVEQLDAGECVDDMNADETEEDNLPY